MMMMLYCFWVHLYAFLFVGPGGGVGEGGREDNHAHPTPEQDCNDERKNVLAVYNNSGSIHKFLPSCVP